MSLETAIAKSLIGVASGAGAFYCIHKALEPQREIYLAIGAPIAAIIGVSIGRTIVNVLREYDERKTKKKEH